jgi:hypothetical protein
MNSSNDHDDVGASDDVDTLFGDEEHLEDLIGYEEMLNINRATDFRQKLGLIIQWLEKERNRPGSKDSHITPAKKHRRTAVFEQLEQIIVAAGDVTNEPMDIAALMDNTIKHVSTSLTEDLSAKQKDQLLVMLKTANAEVEKSGLNLTSAQTSLNVWKSESPYSRSAYDAADGLAQVPGSKLKSYKKLMNDHARVIGGFLDTAKQIVKLEAEGKKSSADKLAKQMGVDLDHYHYNHRGFTNLYNIGKDFRNAGLNIPRNARDFVREMERQNSTEKSKSQAVDSAKQSNNTNIAKKNIINADLQKPAIDLRPAAHTIDGNTPAEISAIDAYFQSEIGEILKTDVILNQTSGNVTDRMSRTTSKVTINISDVEMKKMLKDLSDAVAAKGANHVMTASDIYCVLQGSPIAAGIEEYAREVDTENRVDSEARMRAEYITELHVMKDDLTNRLQALDEHITKLVPGGAEEGIRALAEQKDDIIDQIHTVNLFLLRTDLLEAEQKLQSTVALDPVKLQTEALSLLQEGITTIDSTQQIDHIVPYMNISVYSDMPGQLRLQPIYMPEGLALRMGDATFPLTPKLEGQVYFVDLAGVSTSPNRNVHMVDLINASTGEVIADNLAGFGVASGKHTYTTNNGYGDYIHTNIRNMEYIAYDYVHPLAPEVAQQRDLYVGLMNSLQNAQGNAILAPAAHALSLFDDSPGAALDAISYLNANVMIERTAEANEAAAALLGEILNICEERPDHTELTLMVQDLKDRQALLQEAGALLDLMQTHGATPEQMAGLSSAFNLATISNEHMLQAITSFATAQAEGTVFDQESYERMLLSSVQGIDLSAMTNGSMWEGATNQLSGVPLKIIHTESAAAGIINVQDGRASLSLPSTLTGIDLSQFREAVTGVRLQLSHTGNAPTVLAYRDNILIGSYTPDANGNINILELEGLTHLLIQHDAMSTALLGNLSVLTADGIPQDAQRALSASTSREIAMMMAPSPESWNAKIMKYIAGNIDVDPTMYTRVSVHGYQTEATIRSISFFNGRDANDREAVPNEFITKINNNTWIIHPGTPGQLHVEVEGASARYRGRSMGWDMGYKIDEVEGLTSQSVERTGPLSINFDRYDFDSANSDGHYQVYWMDNMPNYIQSRGRITGTGNFWVKSNVTNTGAVGGMVKIDLYGVNAETDLAKLGQPQHTISAHFEPGGQKLLHAWATIPRTADTKSGSIMARVTYPDGRTEDRHIAYTSPAREMSFTSRSIGPDGKLVTKAINPYSPEEQERILRAQVRLANAMGEQGKIEEQKRIMASIPVAVSGGAGAHTIDANVRTQIASLGVPVPTENIAYSEEKIQRDKADTMNALVLVASVTSTDVPVYGWNMKLAEENKTYDLGEITSLENALQQVSILPNKHATIKFSLAGHSMASFWAEPSNPVGVPFTYDLSLELKGPAQNKIHASDKINRDAGESISSSLPILKPGEQYELIIRDITKYPYAGIPSFNPIGRVIPVGIHIQPYDSRNIEGRISITERASTKPVRMSVAEFENGDRLTTAENGISKTKPVWVVIHGMYSSDKASIMAELAQSIEQYENVQVITVDWEKAADPGFVPTRDAPWAVGVGQWTARQLIGAGVNPANINIAGWSHGTYVGYELAREIERITNSQINTIVALDAANNIPLISNYDHSVVNFAGPSRNALAIDSSIVAGSDTLARTADVSFQINSVSLSTTVRHKLAVTALTKILNNEQRGTGGFSQYFALGNLMKGIDTSNLALNKYNGAFEGIIDVSINEIMMHDGLYYEAIPNTLKIKKPGSTIDDIIHFDSLYA